MTALATASHLFLTDARVHALGELSAPMLLDGSSWIERRKEVVTILDETALRRAISVEFSLRADTAPFLQGVPPESGMPSDGALFCAPIFALPKAPAGLMAFDLTDESGTCLRLLGRDDNARVSGATLLAMARSVLGGAELATAVARQLERIARRGPEDADRHVRALFGQSSAASPAGGAADTPSMQQGDALSAQQARALAASERFVWWTRTMARNSLVVVLYRAARPGRKLIKLSFEQAIRREHPWRVLLGWEAYSLWLDSPLVDARSYHLEATAPSGMYFVKATQSGDGDDDVAVGGDPSRRVHLYRSEATHFGSGATVLLQRVDPDGFIRGAFYASAGTSVVLAVCVVAAATIERSPTSAPALLLLLPGLIASYLARPDQHALTGRLLRFARRLLILSAVLAYVGSAVLALGGPPAFVTATAQDRATDLRWIFGGLCAVSAVPLIGLGIAWRNARDLSGRRRRRTIQRAAHLECSVRAVEALLEGDAWSPVRAAGYRRVSGEAVKPGVYEFVRLGRADSWALSVAVSADGEGLAAVSVRSEYVGRWPRRNPTKKQHAREMSRVESIIDAVRRDA